MADTAEQARVRASLQSRGNRLAPRVDTSTGQPKQESRTKRAARTAVAVAAPESRVAEVVRKPKPARLGPSADSYARKARAQAAGQGAAPPRRPGGGAVARKRGRSAYKSLAGRASGGTLLAEYFVGVLILCIGGLTKGPTAGYTDAMSELLLRLTALTGVFFVLFLMTGSEQGGKAAAWMGLLVDLGILYTATKANTITAISAVMRGQPTGVDETTLVDSTTVAEPTRTQLPNE